MPRNRWATAARVVTAVLGGYVVASGLLALGAVGLPRLTGMARSEAVVLSSMLAFVIYLVLLLWGFSARSPARLALTFAGLAIGSFGLVALIGRG
jgi:hypothetical protein